MTTADKIDLLKLHKSEYLASTEPVILDIGPARYLAVEGHGTPGSPGFLEAIEALFAMAYTIKMRRKVAGGPDYVIAKLEGRFWSEDPGELVMAPKTEWSWALQIRTPEFITDLEREEAIEALLDKGKPERVREVALIDLEEGRCVQALHVGPYEKEPETIGLMRAHASSQDLEFHGQHHEIYLSDPRRIPPDRLRTLLRQPVRPS